MLWTTHASSTAIPSMSAEIVAGKRVNASFLFTGVRVVHRPFTVWPPSGH